MLQTKAKEVAQRLHVEKFQASNRWLESFRTRHNIISDFFLVNQHMEAVEAWKSKLQQVFSEYPPEDKFNADKTGLFYRYMSRKNLYPETGEM
jgi:hypothetical protein